MRNTRRVSFKAIRLLNFTHDDPFVYMAGGFEINFLRRCIRLMTNFHVHVFLRTRLTRPQLPITHIPSQPSSHKMLPSIKELHKLYGKSSVNNKAADLDSKPKLYESVVSLPLEPQPYSIGIIIALGNHAPIIKER